MESKAVFFFVAHLKEPHNLISFRPGCVHYTAGEWFSLWFIGDLYRLHHFPPRNIVDGRNPKQPPGMSKTHVNGMNYQPQLVIAGFLNHQQ